MEIKYTKTFLSTVIIRIDLANALPNIEKGLPSNLTKSIIKHFPISEPQKVTEGTLQINTSEVMSSPTRQTTLWNFFGKEREKTLCVAEKYLYIEYKKYKNFTNMQQEFFSVLTSFFKDFPEIHVNRFGLRYINNIDLNESNPTAWEKYISADLLSIFKIPSSEEKITRAFHVLSTVKNDCHLTFQFGMHNPDYPAPLSKKIFILDLDSYFQGEQTYSDLEKNIYISHTTIQEYFEKAITNSLRTKMKIKK